MEHSYLISEIICYQTPACVSFLCSWDTILQSYLPIRSLTSQEGSEFYYITNILFRHLHNKLLPVLCKYKRILNGKSSHIGFME